jgi:hypothetical protein
VFLVLAFLVARVRRDQSSAPEGRPNDRPDLQSSRG